MNFSLSVSRPAVSLWWGMLWRSFLWMLVLLIPLMILVFILVFGLSFAGLMLGLEKEVIEIGMRVFSFLLNNVMLPVLLMGFVFWRIFRRGRLGSYAISGTYRGQPAKTLGTSLKFGAFVFLECLKYVWPLFFAGMGAGVIIAKGPEQTARAADILAFVVVFGGMLYLHLLVLTDLLRRRTFGRCHLEMQRQEKA